jgi:hypothetical protein
MPTPAAWGTRWAPTWKEPVMREDKQPEGPQQFGDVAPALVG